MVVNLVTFVHHCKRQAGIDPTPIDNHGTRAALAMVAALLRSGQMKMFPQCVEQCRAIVDIEVSAFTIHRERQL
jgi:hypothetical protein